MYKRFTADSSGSALADLAMKGYSPDNTEETEEHHHKNEHTSLQTFIIINYKMQFAFLLITTPLYMLLLCRVNRYLVVEGMQIQLRIILWFFLLVMIGQLAMHTVVAFNGSDRNENAVTLADDLVLNIFIILFYRVLFLFKRVQI